MTRKHFKIVAQSVQDAWYSERKNVLAAQRQGIDNIYDRLVAELCMDLRQCNPNFDATRFAEACDPRIDGKRIAA